MNLRGTMIASRAAIPHLRRRGGGASSTPARAPRWPAGSRTAPTARRRRRCNSLTQSIATQHGKEGIRCNAISPGLIVTPATQDTYAGSGVGDIMLRHHLTPRLGRPEDIAAAVVFLASDEAAFITGQVICVDGGLLAHQPYVADFAGRTCMSVARRSASSASRRSWRSSSCPCATPSPSTRATSMRWSSCSPPTSTAAAGAPAARR